ncbi:hypothetical protein BDF22DRAFT_694467 [Syncephalis plumigaleata]|nr:hypothetical protein BDF22DRAFT_694467 [Syncephalis plumigaleata]
MNPARVVSSASYLNDHPYQQQLHSSYYQQPSSPDSDICHDHVDGISSTTTTMPDASAALPDELVHGLREIYKLFLEPDAEYELNLSHQVRRDLLRQFKRNELHADMLQPAMSEILMLMYLNTYPRFLEWVEQQDRRKQGSRRGSTKRWSISSHLLNSNHSNGNSNSHSNGRRVYVPFTADANELRSGTALRMAKENGW